jgi:hypothetical protein
MSDKKSIRSLDTHPAGGQGPGAIGVLVFCRGYMHVPEYRSCRQGAAARDFLGINLVRCSCWEPGAAGVLSCWPLTHGFRMLIFGRK